MKKKSVSKRIESYLKKRGWTVYQAAKEWNLPYNTIRDWASGDHEPRGASLMMLDVLLGE